jgi:K+-sensing histidine kinase KdpD
MRSHVVPVTCMVVAPAAIVPSLASKLAGRRTPWRCSMLEKLLLAVDRSEHSHKAIPAAVELARASGGAVHVLDARELHYPVPPTVRDERLQEAQQLVDGIVAHKLTQLSTCPVLVVRDQASLEERHHDVLRAQTRFQS